MTAIMPLVARRELPRDGQEITYINRIPRQTRDSRASLRVGARRDRRVLYIHRALYKRFSAISAVSALIVVIALIVVAVNRRSIEARKHAELTGELGVALVTAGPGMRRRTDGESGA